MLGQAQGLRLRCAGARGSGFDAPPTRGIKSTDENVGVTESRRITIPPGLRASQEGSIWLWAFNPVYHDDVERLASTLQPQTKLLFQSLSKSRR